MCVCGGVICVCGGGVMETRFTTNSAFSVAKSYFVFPYYQAWAIFPVRLLRTVAPNIGIIQCSMVSEQYFLLAH